MSDSLQYHINLGEKDGAKYAILPGDQGRTQIIASYLENPEEIMYNREFRTFSGTLEGEKVLVVSTGIGGPSAAICVEELAKIGVDTFIRVGTCGGMQDKVLPGDVVIASGAIRMDGTSKEYMPIEFPAVADFRITAALDKAAEELGIRRHVGVVQAKDSFYGQHSPDTMGVSYELKQKWEAWIKGGCLASEMESATLFIVASLRRLRAGAVFHCVWNQELAGRGMPQDEMIKDTTLAVKTAVEALKIIINEDRKNG
ncbi:MAG: uridine phosphorylase [Clostridia bacterium]|nr:uridine phosphorylase [Clostridia bacterium]